MKRIRNIRLVHPCGRVEWIMTRAVTAGGLEQELCLIVSIDSGERRLGRRRAPMLRIAMARRTLRFHVNRLRAPDNQSGSAQT